MSKYLPITPIEILVILCLMGVAAALTAPVIAHYMGVEINNVEYVEEE